MSREMEKGGSYTEMVKTSSRDLWVIFALKGFWSLSENALASVLVLFLSVDLQLDDIAAGWVFGAMGLGAAVYGLVCGFLVDILGVRWSMMVGSVLMSIGLMFIAMSHDSFTVITALLTLKAFGSALLLNPMMFAIRRFTTAPCRPFAFSCFYVVNNISFFLAQLLVNVVRNSHGSGWGFIFDSYSIWRIVIGAAAVCGVITVLLSFFIRNPPDITNEEEHLQDHDSSSQKNVWAMTKLTFSEAKFWRLTALSTAFVGVRLIFVHLAATFPTFWTRAMGANSPFELIVAVNPVCIIAFVPVLTTAVIYFKLGNSLVLITGAFVTGISPLPLAHSTSYLTAVLFVVLLSIGEALWSPKFLEYSVVVSPIGREGTYSALSSMPIFLSTLLAGGLSGYLLHEYCPSAQQCDGRPIWLTVAATTLISPVLLVLCKSCVFVEDDLVPDQEPIEGRYGSARA